MLSKTNLSLNKISPFIILCVGYVGITFIAQNNFFFWDTIQLGSKQAHWFFDNNFSKGVLLPNNIDSGHPPIFGLYVSVVWLLFGKTLIASHWAMFPFLIGIAWQINAISSSFFKGWKRSVLVLFLFLEPALLTQSTLISPDIPLFFFFLWNCNLIFKNSNKLKWLALIGLGFISLRGSFLVAALLFFDVVYPVFFKNKSLLESLKNNFKIYFVPLLTLILWYSYHLVNSGWLGFHSNSPWIGSFGLITDYHQFYKQIIYAIWAFIDHGRGVLFLIGVLSFGVFYFDKKSFFSLLNEKIKKTLVLFAIIFLFFSPFLFIFKSLTAHRYYLPHFVLLIILSTYFIFNLKNKLIKKGAVTLSLLSLIAGHFVVYPEKISQSWEATLGHIPYYNLMQNMKIYIKENGIKRNEIGTGFPNLDADKFVMLNTDTSRFSKINLSQNNYVLYSNVFNVKYKILQELHTDKWEVVKEFSKGQVYVKLYKKLK